MLALFNIKLDRWVPNPRRPRRIVFHFWPYYQVRALLGRLNTKLSLVNISDGGFIDNLGVFELLRRRCKLIVALDNTYDPNYDFKHLRNLVMRARSELGLEITFREDPEERIRPSASQGFSEQHFVVADIATIAGHPRPWQGGVLVYAKASLTRPLHWNDPEQQHEDHSGFAYKTYHPHFPQESTGDQFFDKDQWQAHYTLGQEIAARVLRFINLETARDPHVEVAALRAIEAADVKRDQLRTRMIERFEQPQDVAHVRLDGV